jgi:hypothetical protein
VGADRQIKFVEPCGGQFGTEVNAGPRDRRLLASERKISVGPKLQLQWSLGISGLREAP